MLKKIFITGVSSGIGLGLAKGYLNENWEVYGISRRSPHELEHAANFRFQSVDLRRFESIEPALKNLFLDTRSLDLVVLNAGVLGRIADLSDCSLAEMYAVMDVNVWANKLVLDTIYQLNLRPQQVVAISSGSAAVAHRGWNAYSISKAALNMLIGLYAAERPETHFCALAPGIVDTAMQDQIAAMPADAKFSSLDLLRECKGTPFMPHPDQAAGTLMAAFEHAPKHPSGSFLDLRQLSLRR